ncbi:MAG: hypothetical protein AB7S26_07200 [Sandaracinaceae bacterium]
MIKPQRMFSVAIFLGALVSVACGSRQEPVQEAPPPQPVAVDHYTGHWRGVANISTDLPNAPPTMDIETTITAGGGVCGSIEYGAIGCSGVWSCTSSYDAGVMIIEETIRYGQERCPTNARVELRQTADPDRLEFHYNGVRIQGSAVLERVPNY